MTRGERVIAFIEEFCHVPEGKLRGRKIQLDAFQKRFILAVYDNPHGTSKGILSIARKNGKTALIACLLLAHLVGPEAVENSQIVSGALSRDQAGIVFDLACKIIRYSPLLSEIIKIVPSGKRLYGLPMAVEYRALAAEAKTTHGLSPILAIMDELGQIKGPKNDFVDAIETAQGAYDNPLILCISTQAAEDADLLSLWIDDALAEGADPSVVCHLYAANPDAALDDMDAWRAANPALGTFNSVANVKKLATKAERMPSFENTFRNLHLNQRVALHNGFMSKKVWEPCAAPPDLSVFERNPVYLGIDLSSRRDLTAVVAVSRCSDTGIVHVLPYFFAPDEGVLDRELRDKAPYTTWAKQGHLVLTPGPVVNYATVAGFIADLVGKWDVQAAGFDRWRVDVLQTELDRLELELTMVPYGQGFKDMAPAIDALEALALQSALAHGGHPVLTMCMFAAIVVTDPSGNRKLDKSKAIHKIDGAVALAMAVALLESAPETGNLDDFLASANA